MDYTFLTKRNKGYNGIKIPCQTLKKIINWLKPGDKKTKNKHIKQKLRIGNIGCGGRIWTYDLQVMSLTSYRAAPPRVNLCGSLFVSFPWFEVTTFKSMYHSLIWPGSDLLSHALRRSTIGAEGFHDRVRDGIGCRPLAITTRPDERMVTTFNRD